MISFAINVLFCLYVTDSLCLLVIPFHYRKTVWWSVMCTRRVATFKTLTVLIVRWCAPNLWLFYSYCQADTDIQNILRALQFKSVVQRRRMPSSCADATRVYNLAPSIQLIHVRSHCDTQPPNGDTHPKLQVEWDFPLIPPFVPSTKSANFVRAIRGPSFPLCNIPLILFSLDGHDQMGSGQPRPAPLASLHHASTLR
jgi:hypothetical protein